MLRDNRFLFSGRKVAEAGLYVKEEVNTMRAVDKNGLGLRMQRKRVEYHVAGISRGLGAWEWGLGSGFGYGSTARLQQMRICRASSATRS